MLSLIQHFLPQLIGQIVLIRSDSMTVVQYISKQGGGGGGGGARSPRLCYQTWKLWKIAIKNLFKGCAPSRSLERSGGPIIESGNTFNTMVIRQSDSQRIFLYMRHSNDRFVCNRTKSQASNVLFMAAGPVSICHRRSVDSVGKHGSICISPQ